MSLATESDGNGSIRITIFPIFPVVFLINDGNMVNQVQRGESNFETEDSAPNGTIPFKGHYNNKN